MPTDEKLPDDIAALLRDARTELPPAGAKERVWSKTMAQIDAPAPGTPSVSSEAPASAVRTAALSGFGAGLLAGIAGTAVVVSMLAGPANVAKVPVPSPEPLASVFVSAPTPPPILTPTRAAKTPAPTATPVAMASDAERATERAWLDAARTALGRGDFDAAMQALETARTRFPNGSLSEEREAIAVHVLLGRGDVRGATLAAEVFEKRHKGSLFLPAIKDALNELQPPPQP